MLRFQRTMQMANRSTLARIGLALGAAVVLCLGCDRNSIKLSSSEKQAFEQANPEIKQAWERALAADKAKDYANAQSLLDSLGQMQLNEAQKQALATEREAFNQRLWQAAEKNDPAAVKAVQASQNSRRAAPRP
jgi:hypothetical protein